MLYTSENHSVTIQATIGARGHEVLEKLGFINEFTAEAMRRKEVSKERLAVFVAGRKAKHEAREAEIWREEETPKAEVTAEATPQADLFNL